VPAATELRVFISSTFRDLQEEREHLVKKIFPEIRVLCRERGIRFTEVDLRWGLTDEDVALGQVIRTCLEEVDKCRPYFIGITGDRYGFIPTHLDIYKDPAVLEQYPWIEDAVINQMSITEMEAQYGVLASAPTPVRSSEFGGADGGGGAHFYFRRHRESLDDDNSNDEESQRLEAYQQRIRQSNAIIEHFRDPVSLGELIYDDLVKIIKRDFADARPPTPLEEERSRHEAFSLSRRRAYIPNPAYLKRLNDHAKDDSPPLVVYAESGSGKSSLFAFWAEQYRRKNPEAHLIEHYVGIGATATAHYAIIRHVCMEINERFGRTEEIPSEPAKLELALGQWLGYADHELKKRGESMVLILDGLNQLQGDALNLRWIPDVISPTIRLILSSTVEGTLVELQKRGWSRFGMQALSEAERETVVVRYLAEYHKSLNAEQIKRLASDYKCGHPLFLKTVLEELRLVGRHEELDAKIEIYLDATGTEDLFQRVLERIEDDYSQRAVRDVMVLLSASRSGLDERELSELSGLARLKIATMMAGLDYHLVHKEGRLTFFHDYLRRAVEKRYLADEQKQRTTHLQIAEYFQNGVRGSIASGTEVSVRTASELAYQLHSGGALDRLRDSLSSMPVFLVLYAGETLYEVLGYWSSMEAGTDIVGRYRRGLAEWAMEDAADRIRGMGRVSDLLQRLGEWSGAIDLERERCAAAIELGEKSEEAATRRSIGCLLTSRGEYAEAMEELTQALDLYTELGDRRGVSQAIGTIGNVYTSRGEYDRALECYERLLSIDTELGDRSGVSIAIGNMGNVYSDRGENDRALECFERSLSIFKELGDRHGVSLAIGNMGRVDSSRGENDRALECYERQLSIAEELGDRQGVSFAIGNMGIVYANLGEYDRALECYERQLSIDTELGNRRGVSIAIGNMGSVYTNRGENDRALECFSRAATEHREISFRYGLSYWLAGTARVLVELVEHEEAMPAYLPHYVGGLTGESWQAVSLRVAREQAEECVLISEELSKPDTLFAARVVLARIAAGEGSVESALGALRTLLGSTEGDDQRARCHYWLWKFTPPDAATDTDHRAEALQLYGSLIEKTPKHEYRRYVDELSAATEQIRPEGTDAATE
jgi:tetratricopeptide (TPR) repeat protein